MKLCLRILAVTTIAATTYSLVSCATPSGFSYQNVSISIAAACTNCPDGIDFNPNFPEPANVANLNTSANGGGTGGTSTIPPGAVMIMVGNGGEGSTVYFTATVNNAPSNNVSWSLSPAADFSGSTDTFPFGTSAPGGVAPGSTNIGQFDEPSSSYTTAVGPVAYYFISSVPTYGGAQFEAGQAMMASYGLPGVNPDGFVMVTASVPSDPSNPSAVVSTNLLIQFWNSPGIYLNPATPTVPAALTTPAVTVSHNGCNGAPCTFQFSGTAYGAAPCFNGCSPNPLWTTDNTVVWKVGTASTNAVVCATPGAACPNGSIDANGLYTAPATIPATATVVVCASHYVGTVTKFANVGIN